MYTGPGPLPLTTGYYSGGSWWWTVDGPLPRVYNHSGYASVWWWWILGDIHPWILFAVVVVDLGGSALPSTSSRGGGGGRPWLGSVPRAMRVVVVVVG